MGRFEVRVEERVTDDARPGQGCECVGDTSVHPAQTPHDAERMTGQPLLPLEDE